MAHTPEHNLKQTEFLFLDCKEAMYGGAAGGGKSDALLMAALQYVDVSGYKAIIFRRTLADARLEFVPRAEKWLRKTEATWNGQEMAWTFPSGAMLFFGYIKNDGDEYRYDGVEFQFIGYDELTQFKNHQYTYLFSRLRSNVEVADRVPLRMRSATNPGGIGHDWVKERFLINREKADRTFIPARLSDNPYLQQDSYIESLNELSERERQQKLEGDWDAADDGLLSTEKMLDCTTACLWPNGIMPSGSRPELFIGVDQGRTRDLTVVWNWERVGDVLWCRECFIMEKTQPKIQKAEIKRRLTRWVMRCGIDEGAQGWDLANELEREHKGIVEAVSLSPQRQGQLATMFHRRFDDRLVRIPDDDVIRQDFRLIRRPDTKGQQAKLTTDRDESGHGDRFWAAAIGVWLASDAPKRPVLGVPVARPSSLAGRR